MSNRLKTRALCLVSICFLLPLSLLGQRGKIIRPGAPTATSIAMDPNQDRFVSATTSGFSTDGDYVGEFEITMFGIPQVGGDVTGDNTGNSCGITDLIPDFKGRSVYAVLDGNNLIFRFRVGDDNPSVESWTILLDSDGLYGAADPNSTPDNPGFEIDITLIKRNNAGVYVYDINGIDNCPSPLLSYPISTNFQISIADEVTCGDPDYFYDFFVPFNQLSSAFGISSATGLRFVAVTNVSATCAMAGQIADVSGVDNNLPEYSGCVTCAFLDLVENQCPTPIDDLCQTCGGFEKDKVSAPTIDTPVRAGQTIISGTSDPGIYIIVEIYSRIGGTDTAPIWSTTPRETKNNTAIGTLWAVTLSAPLQSYDKIIAKAQKNATSVPCGINGANQASASVTVVQPNTPPVAQSQTVLATEDVPKNIVLTGTDPESNPLIYTIVTPPLHGVLNGTGPGTIYTPASDYNGPDSFTFQVSDGIFSSVLPGTVSITVAPVNDAPVANNQSVTILEDAATAITLTASDVDGGGLTYSVVSAPLHGVLSGSGATLTYTPASNYNGTDSFTFKANDGLTDSNTATVSINMTSVPDSPIANAQSVTTLEDTPKAITLTGTDPDGGAINYLLVTNPLHGTLSGSGANLIFTPTGNYSGPDSFTFKVNDGTSDSNIATVSITISPVNDTPIANNQSVSTPEDIAKGITLTGSDVDGNPLSYIITSAPLHGTLSGTAPNLTYTPTGNYNGPDNFTFKVNDGFVDSNTATVSLSITPVNDAPAANNQNVATPEDVALAITLSGNDVEGSALTYSIVSPPTNGSLSGSAPNVTYTPNLNYNGPDNFTFKVNDGALDSSPATVTIVVTPVNDSPIANNQSANYNLNTPKGITLTGSDPEGSALTFAVLAFPTNGTLTGTAPNLTYTPNTGYSGADTFTFQVSDGTSTSNVATVTLSLTPGSNLPPVAFNQTINVAEEVPTLIILNATDPNGDALTYSNTSPVNGTLSGIGPNVTYTSAVNYNGPDSFTFTVNDGLVNSNTATVSITVTSVNDAPTSNDQSVSTPENIAIGITLAGNDVDGDALTYTIGVNPTHGTLSGSAPNVIYTPTANFNGPDNFTFKTNDGFTNSNFATVSILVTAVNNPPIANPQSVTIQEDVSQGITLTAIDIDLDGLSYIIVTPPSHGSLSGSAPNLIYTPALNYNGPDNFTFKVNDGSVDSSPATVSINLTSVNDLPISDNQSVITAEDLATVITLTGSDIDGDPLLYSIVSGPSHGTLTGTGTSITYTPTSNYNGFDSFTFKANDGAADSNVGVVSLTITPVSDPPVAFDLGGALLTTLEDLPKVINLVGTDPDGDALTYIIVTPPAHGIISGTGPSVTYTPSPGYNGPDAFTFKVNDGSSDSNIANVAITITPVNYSPISNDQNLSTAEDLSKAFVLTGSDGDSDPLTYIVLTQPSNGTLTGTGPNLNYLPQLNFEGSDSFTFKSNDGAFDSNIATISFNVTPVNDAPVIAPLPTLYTKEDSTLQICLNVIDVDGNLLTFLAPTNSVGGGTMVRDIAPFDFCYLFTPAADYNGESIWDLKVRDSDGLIGSLSVKIIISPVNDPPVAVRDVVTAIRNVSLTGNVLDNDFDIEGDAMFVNIKPLVNVQHGKVTLNSDGIFSYTSDKTFKGIDSLVYEVCDNGSPSRCSKASLVISVEDLPFKVFEGVTPDGDGVNDYLRINSIDYYANNQVQIFDRFNNLVFEINSYDNEERIWRGQANKGIGNDQLPEGTYFYLVNLGDGSAPASGFVVLKRN